MPLRSMLFAALMVAAQSAAGQAAGLKAQKPTGEKVPAFDVTRTCKRNSTTASSRNGRRAISW
jgi:hypothetical protein